MAGSLTTLRVAVRDKLQEQLDVEFGSGRVELEGGIARGSKGFVWIESIIRSPETALIENVELHALLYLQYVEARSDDEPVDPEPLELAIEQLVDAVKTIKTVQVDPGDLWLLSFVGAGPNYESQSAEAIFTARHESRFETS